MKIKLIDIVEREVDLFIHNHIESIEYWALSEMNKPVVYNDELTTESSKTNIYNKLVYRTSNNKDRIVYLSDNFVHDAPSLFNDLITDYMLEAQWQKFRNDHLQDELQEFKKSMFYKLYKFLINNENRKTIPSEVWKR